MIVRIKSARDGYRRCGVAHPRQVTDHPADRFTEDELERLQADPVLTVTLVDGDLESIQEPSGGLGAAPAGVSPEPAPVPAAEPAPAPAAAPQKPAKAQVKAPQKAAAKKGSAKVSARGKGGAKAPAKEGTEAAQEGQSADDANSSAKPAEGEGSEGGQE
ncbi:HI1506-related protein [Pseudomonas nitroreducens]|uniref:Mu-like prophage FluMu N-terminal domain-containing protein n=1 Tax=Pseudomonas nitroreducens TaxID=46680 RepID=A0A6G6IT28_PSENT|nr:HI1506-related protein [Pseudomonas nitroreducens]QIE86152.1 hypothetical protein G5B91_07695 [Pseudomonas nitroreducens]